MTPQTTPQTTPSTTLPGRLAGRLGRWLFSVGLVVLTSALTGLVAAPANATYPGRNGRIVYVNTLDSPDVEVGVNEIFTVRPNRTGRRQLTYRVNNDSPDWAPAGHRIAYVHWLKSGAVRIWVMGANGHHKHQLVPGGRHDFDQDPVWAPGGKRILFIRSSGVGRVDLMVYSLASHTVRALHVGRGFSLIPESPAWSPDGRTIVFTVLDKGSNDGDPQTDLFTVRADGTGLTQLTRTATTSEEGVDWSPDGRRLLFTRLWGACEEEVNTMNPDGTARRRVRSGCTASEPAWSPDGHRILTYAVIGRRWGVWAMTPTGAHRRFIARGGDGHWQPLR